MSVVIPTYNYGRFLSRALDSVLAQTERADEIIVVDDGSTDDTRHVLARYANHVHAIHQENRGLSAARNAGIARSGGDLVAFLDSDDTWHPRKLELQLDLWRRYPDSGAIGCGVQVVDSGGVAIRTLRFANAEGEVLDRLRAIALRRRWVGGSGSGALVPADVLRSAGGFDETLAAAEDWDLWLRIAANHPIRNVDATLASIWDHRSGSFRDFAKMELGQRAVLHKLEHMRAPALDRLTLRQARAMILADAAGEAYGASEWPASTSYATLAVLEWPLSLTYWRLMVGSGLRWLARR